VKRLVSNALIVIGAGVGSAALAVLAMGIAGVPAGSNLEIFPVVLGVGVMLLAGGLLARR